MPWLRRYWPILFLAICAALPLWRPIFFGETIGPWDQIRHMAPWNGPPSSRPWDVLQADGVLQFYPWRDMVFDAWGKGQIPAWNPYELGGTPLLANSQSGGFYPLHILMGVLHVPTGIALTLLAWFHLFWAGLGTYFLARRCGAIRTGAAVAGAGFCLSPFMLSWTGLASVITTVAWIPWVLAIVVVVFQEKPSPKHILTLAMCVAAMLLGGHLQFCAYGVLAAALLAIWLAVQTKSLAIRRIYGALFGLVVGALLAAPQLLPVLSYSKFSHRANKPSDVGYTAYTAGAIPIYALQGLAFPTALGNPAKPSPAFEQQAGSDQSQIPNAYWPALTHVGADFAETAIGLGPVLFILLFLMRKPRGPAAAMAAVGFVGLLMALGTAINWPLYFWAPGWSATGSPDRAGVLFVLAACVLAGVSLSSLSVKNLKAVQAIAVLTGLFGLILAFAPILFGISYPSPLGMDVAKAIKATVSTEAPLLLVTLIIACAAVLAAYREQFRWAAPLAVAGCAFIAYGVNLIPSSSGTLPKVEANTTERYAFINPGWGLMTPVHALMPPNTATLSRIHEIGGYDSLLHRDTVDLLKEIDNGDPAPPANGNMMLIKPNVNMTALGDAGVAHVWSMRPLAQGQQAESDGIYRVDMGSNGRAYTPAGAAQIVSETYSSLSLTATGPGPLVVKDRNMPGWTALVDGKETPLTPGLWRQVDLGPGQHQVEFRYSPDGMIGGLVLSVFALWIGASLYLGPLLYLFLARKTDKLIADPEQRLSN